MADDSLYKESEWKEEKIKSEGKVRWDRLGYNRKNEEMQLNQRRLLL